MNILVGNTKLNFEDKMARKLKEERDARLAQEQAAAEAALAAYLLTVPKRLMDAQALAQNLGVSVNVSLTETGPSVHFYSEASVIDDTLTYQTEEWELEYLERKLHALREEKDARTARLTLARDVWKNRLTETERAALKENTPS